MKKMGIEALYRRPKTTKPAPGHKVYPYLLRNLAVIRPNQVWAMDITYVPMARGFVYLAASVLSRYAGTGPPCSDRTSSQTYASAASVESVWPAPLPFSHHARRNNRAPAAARRQRAREGARPGESLAAPPGERRVRQHHRARRGQEGRPVYLCRVLRLALLAPEIVEAIMDGRQAEEVTLPALMRGFPVEWEGQRAWQAT
jgi:transposase InsO family protein